MNETVERSPTRNRKDETRINTSHVPDLDFVCSLSNSSTPLGQCLQTALLSMKTSNPINDRSYQEKKSDDAVEDSSSSLCGLDLNAVQSIQEDFGLSISLVQMQESRRLTVGMSNEVSLHPNIAPRALLSGRITYYNRVGQNWRLLMDRSVRVAKRPSLLLERRRKRRRNSLWHSNSSAETMENEVDIREQELTLQRNHGVQILGYNDV